MESELILYDVDRLDHVVHADTKKSFTAFETVRVSHTVGGKITWEGNEERAVGTLEPRVLKKLRDKAIFSIRGELEMIGEIEIADKIIFGS